MPERLTALDAQFLHLETPANHMHVAGLMIYEAAGRPGGPLTFDDLVRLIDRRIHLVPRFRQKVRFLPLNLGRPVWVDDPGFDLAFHIRRSALPAPGGRRELAEAVQRIHSRPLDRSKPLWEMYFFEGLEDGHVAVLSKVHHCMIDGMSGIDIATVLLDFTVEPRAVEPEPYVPYAEPSAPELIAETIREQISNPIRAGLEMLDTARRAPRLAAEQLAGLAEGVASVLAAGQAPASPLNQPVGPNRRFAMTEATVDDFKLVKNALGGTVNDVVLACVAGALHRFLTARAIATTGMTLRAMVPVSTRDESKRMALGNRVTNIFVDLPVGPIDEAERLRSISALTKDLKSSHQAIGAAAIMGAGAWAPPTLHALAARLASRGRFINLTVSNVPGPQVPMYMDGARLVLAYPMMPLAETAGLSIAVTSLSGMMGFGLTSDWDTLPDIDVVCDGIMQTLDALKKAAGA
ncbi:MAG TPA: wax ester/triacylglycerol synthase family O-acyltransferase [Actinomycetota bacterium]